MIVDHSALQHRPNAGEATARVAIAMNAKYCSTPGCTERIPVGAVDARCPKHGTRAYGGPQRRQGTRQQRGYGKRWQVLRATVLAEQPICAKCGTEWAAEVDHIEPIAKRPALQYVRSNLQGLCIPCHREKTYRETLGRGTAAP